MRVQSVQNLFFIVKYANLLRSCYRRRRCCLSLLMSTFLAAVTDSGVNGNGKWTLRGAYIRWLAYTLF